jgi:ABC-type multidrug transport system fused ATPase/permease subunit
MSANKKLPVAAPPAVLRHFFAGVRKHPWLVLGSLVGPVGLQLSVLATPWYLREFINLLVEPAGTVPESAFVGLIGLIAILMTSAWAMRRLRGWTQIYLEVGVMAELTTAAYAGLLRHSHHFFASQFSGTLTRRITKYRDGFETLYDVLTISHRAHE